MVRSPSLRAGRWWAGAFLAIAAGVALAASFPARDLGWWAWWALIPLLWAVRRAGTWEAAALGLLTGVTLHGVFGVWAPGMCPRPGCVAMGLFCGLYVSAFALGVSFLRARIPRWEALGAACLWGVLEYLRASAGWLATPWGVLGQTQYAAPWVVPIAGIAGVWGVSFAVVGANAVVLDLCERISETRAPKLTPGGAATGFAILALVGAGWLAGRTELVGPEVRVLIVQAGTAGSEDPVAARRAFERYRALTLDEATMRPDLVVWPEAAFTAAVGDPGVLRALAGVARAVDAHLLVGVSGMDKSTSRRPRTWANSALLIAPDGELLGRYDKIRLLPFNEYLPLRGRFPWPRWLRAGIARDARPGAKRTIFTLGESRFGTSICWENGFPAEFRDTARLGANFMVSLTNEAFAGEALRRHTMAMATLRAVENGLVVVRAATTGVSAFISPAGRVEARLTGADERDLDVEGVLIGDVALSRGRTVYQRLGDWFVLAEALVCAGVFSAALALTRG